jgi:hypothetical protein
MEAIEEKSPVLKKYHELKKEMAINWVETVRMCVKYINTKPGDISSIKFIDKSIAQLNKDVHEMDKANIIDGATVKEIKFVKVLLNLRREQIGSDNN